MALFNLSNKQNAASLPLEMNGIQFCEFFDDNYLPMWGYDVKTWQFMFVNNAALRMLGYSRNEFLNKNIKEIRPKEEEEKMITNMTTYTVPEPSGSIIKYKKKNGEIFSVEIFSTEVKYNDKFICVVIANDLIRSGVIEEALRQISAKFQFGLNMGKFASWEVDLVTNYYIYDERPETLFKDLSAYNSIDDLLILMHDEDQIKFKQLVAGLITGKVKKYDIEYRLKHNESFIWFREIGGVVNPDPNKKQIRVLGLTEDITERKLNEEKRNLTESIRFKGIFHNSPDIIMLTDLNGIIKEINRAPVDYNVNDLIGKNIFDFLTPEQKEKTKQVLKEVIKLRQPQNIELNTISPKGRLIHWSIRISTFISNDKPVGFIINYNDTTEIIKTQEQLKANEDALRNFFNHSPSANFIALAEGKIILANQKFLDLFGFKSLEEATRISTISLYKNPQDRAVLIKKIISEKKVENYEIQMVRTDGKIIYIVENVIGQFDKNGKLERIFGYIIDVTDKKTAYDKIRQLSKAIEQSPASIVITDTRGDIVYANQKCIDLTGYSLDELKGKNPRVLKSGETPSEEYKQLWETISSGNIWRGQFHNRKKSGELYWEYAIISPILDENGHIVNYLAVKEDITEKKVISETLNHERILLRTLIDSLPNTIYVKDTECRKVIANKADLQVLGLKSEAEVIGKTDFDFFPKEIAEKFYADDMHVISTGLPMLNREEFYYDTEGKKRWLVTSKLPYKSNKILGLIGIGYDITERKQLEETIKEERNLLRTLIDSQLDLVSFKDVNGKYQLNNQAHLKFLGGKTQAMVIGKTCFDFFDKETAKKIFDEDKEVIQTGSPVINKEEFLLDEKNNTFKWHLTNKIPLHGDDGNIKGLLTVATDITERKLAAEALKNTMNDLRKVNDELQKASSAKSLFLANMSHELRTPLIGIRGFTELLLESTENAEQKDMLKSILISSNRLMNTLSEILEFAKFESEQITPKLEKICTSEFIQAIIHNFEPEAAAKGLYIKFVNNYQHCIANVDKSILEIILSNLISNAIKFTKNGGVKITANQYSEDGMQILEIIIKDTGVGISPEALKVIFEEFRQGSEGFSRQFEGTGLGLTLSKKYAEIIGGNILIESELGKGTTVILKIPFVQY